MERRRLSSQRRVSQAAPPDAVSLIYHTLPCPVQCCHQKFVVSTDHSGDLHVHVQGDLSQQDKRCVFLTVHDLGCNHMSMVEFVNSPAMMEIKERSCFIHVDVPGHEDGAPELPDTYQFPSLCTLGEDLVTVLDAVRAPYAVGLGEGAGGAVLARAALAHPRRILALTALTTGAASARFLDGLRARLSRWRQQDVEDFLVYHKFGTSASASNDLATDLGRDRAVQDYRSRLRGSFNAHNVSLYVKAFLARKELSLRGCTQDVLLLTGALNPYVADVEKLYRDLDKDKATFLKLEKVADIFAEAPGKMAQSLLLFCQGQGLLTSLPPPGVSRRVSRAMSMEDYERPNVRRLSLVPATSHAQN